MAERVLLFDLGNTRLKYCWAIDGTLDSETFGTLDHAHLSELADAAGSYPDRILLASVARDEVTDMLVEMCQRLFGPTVERLHAGTTAGGVSNGYPEPRTLGVDRWLAMLGGVARHGLPLVVMDIGSATTLDAIGDDGRHLGGWILPGPLTMHRALVEDTGLAAEVPAALPGGPATDTAAGIAAGIGGAHRGVLAAFLDGLPGNMDGATVVLTGGGAEPVAEVLRQASNPREVAVDPWLVFAGMLVAGDDDTQGR